MSLIDDFISLIFPRLCMACGNILYKNEKVLCTLCQYHLPKTGFHKERDNTVEQVFWGRVPVEAAAACYYFTKGGKVQALIHQLKYKGCREVGVYLGKIYGRELLSEPRFAAAEVIVPVPLHPKKLRRRKYNQSGVFAEGLSQAMHLPVDDRTLVRTFASETQTRKSRFRRWENVKEIFAVRDGTVLAGRHVLLVDDVITTGATLEACTAALLEAVPGIRVSLAAIACAVR